MGWPGPMTDRQYAAWTEWQSDDLEVPDKATWAILQLTEMVSYVNSTEQRELDPNRWRMEFGPPLPDREETPDERELRYGEQELLCASMSVTGAPQRLIDRVTELKRRVAEARAAREEEDDD